MMVTPTLLWRAFLSSGLCSSCWGGREVSWPYLRGYLWNFGVQKGNPKLSPKLGCGTPKARGSALPLAHVPAQEPPSAPHVTSPVGAPDGQPCSWAAVPLRVRGSPGGLVREWAEGDPETQPTTPNLPLTPSCPPPEFGACLHLGLN